MPVRNALLESFLANFDAAGNSSPNFPAAQNAIPAKVWALSSKEMAAGKLQAHPNLHKRGCANSGGFGAC